VVAANFDRVQRRGLTLAVCMLLFGAFITGFATSPSFVVALVLILASELFAMLGQTFNNTIVQQIIPDAMRGRVMSLMMMTFGVTPLGTLPVSWLAEEYGVRAAVGGGGAVLALFAVLLYALSRTFRRLDTAIEPDESILRPRKSAVGAAPVGD
jgi:MFS family permease